MSSAETSSLVSLKIPSCERCRARKIRCDSAAPKCTSCKRNESACIIVDSVTRERYSRSAVAELEQKLQLLEANATAPSLKSPSEHDNIRGVKTHFVGDGSGLHFFRRLSKNARANFPLSDASPTLRPSPYGSLSFVPHALPARDTADLLVNRYLSHSQLHHPLLAQSSTLALLEQVYDANLSGPSAEDFYRLFMVFAISSITLYRSGRTVEHPYGYFRAAQRYAPQVNFVGSLKAVQNLLLVARFAMYYHIDCSIWDVARFCMRQCIDLGLHQPPLQQLSALEEQIQRNVFWDCYLHDRHSSGILGRPYAIAEADVGIDLPFEASEKELIASQATTPSEVAASRFSIPNEASIFRFVIKLRRIITRITDCFYSSHGHAQHPRRTVRDAGRVRLDLDRFLDELKITREQAPIFSDPQSLYEQPAWHDFLVEKDKLTLIRGALAQMPVDGLHPPYRLLEMASHSATQVIELYSALFSKGQITWTRSYFQIMFTSGLSIMYAMSILKNEKSSNGIEKKEAFLRATGALNKASELMKMFVNEMPDANRFAVVFDMLVTQYTGTGTRTRPSRATTPPPRGQLEHSLMADNVDPNTTESAPLAVPQPEPSLFNTSLMPPPGVDNDMLGDQREYDLGFELGLDDFQNWSLNPTNTDSILGQVEGALGEYAWGNYMMPDDSLWDQWDSRFTNG